MFEFAHCKNARTLPTHGLVSVSKTFQRAVFQLLSRQGEERMTQKDTRVFWLKALTLTQRSVSVLQNLGKTHRGKASNELGGGGAL